MLDITRFDVIGDVLFYEGERHYSISQDPDEIGYVLYVETLNEGNGDFDISGESYACRSVAVAIASIEALENGEEI